MNKPFNLKLTVGAAIRWEQITGRSFYEMDCTQEQDVRRLLYCMLLISGSEIGATTFDVFEELLEDKKVATGLWKSFQTECERVGHFTKSAQQFKSEGENSGKEIEQRIEDIAAMLVISGGLSIEYVMREMLLGDLASYLKAYRHKTEQQMEADRFLAFHVMRPHMDTKKFDSPRKVCIFPWEAEAEAKHAARVLKQEKDTFEKFMRGELFDMNAVTWKKRTN